LTLFNELKRRNVFKVAIAYIVVSWLVLQVADVVLNNITAPGWIFHVLLLFLLIGFPLAIIFAWAFELTPEGLKRDQAPDTDVAMLEETPEAPEEQLVAEAQPPGEVERSIAVLPFVNMSDDASNEYFSDGISEELLNLLSRVSKLRVAAQTSSFSLKGKDLQISEVGEILKVAHVLEGSVRKAGNQVRITVQLIKTNDGFHLWSETYDHTLDDIFKVQGEIAAAVVEQLKCKLAAAVVEQLKCKLLGEIPRIEQTDPAAYALFLQARQMSRQGTASSWDRSIDLYQQALAIDPEYAAAWTDLADVYSRQTNKALRSVDEGNALIREAAGKALEVNQEYAPAHAVLGRSTLNLEGDLSAAARHIERALVLAPGNTEILFEAAMLVRSLGRIEECISFQEDAVSRDPVNPVGHYRLGLSYLWAGHLDESIESERIALALSPGRIGVQYAIGVALLFKGEPEAALEIMHQESDEGWRANGRALAHHELGQARESDAALAKLIEGWEVGAAYNIAYILAFRGEADRAFEWLDKAVKYKDPGLTDIPIQPLFANIHSDPRWLPFTKSIGKSPQQLAAIEFSLPQRYLGSG
jgi:TolB-like protein/Tfp pilus assembly protein PilF